MFEVSAVEIPDQQASQRTYQSEKIKAETGDNNGPHSRPNPPMLVRQASRFEPARRVC